MRRQLVVVEHAGMGGEHVAGGAADLNSAAQASSASRAAA